MSERTKTKDGWEIRRLPDDAFIREYTVSPWFIVRLNGPNGREEYIRKDGVGVTDYRDHDANFRTEKDARFALEFWEVRQHNARLVAERERARGIASASWRCPMNEQPITLTLDLAWIGEGPELIEHQPSKLAGDTDADMFDAIDRADAAIFRQAWREMQDSE